jgi:F-type H+-transporting ATPase subunit b
MSDRTDKIEKSLKDAEKIAANLKNSEEEKQQIIRAARVAAEQVIGEAKKIAEDERKAGVEKAKTEVRKIVDESKAQILSEKAKMLSEVKGQVAELVILASAKVLEKVTDKKIDAELVKETLKEIK